MLDLIAPFVPVLRHAGDEALEVGEYNGSEGGSEGGRQLVAGEVAMQIPELRIVRADGGEEVPVDGVGRTVVGPVEFGPIETELDCGDFRREAGNLHEPVLDRTRACGTRAFGPAFGVVFV